MRLDTLCGVGVSEGTANQRKILDRVQTLCSPQGFLVCEKLVEPSDGFADSQSAGLRVSSCAMEIEGAHEMAAIMAVFEFPPNDSFNNQVKIESRYGTKSSFFFFPLTVSLA
jgi:hypothetical protein